MTHQFHPTSLREYDIRGVVGKTLGEDDAYALGRSFGTLVRRRGGAKSIQIAFHRPDRSVEGRTLEAIAAERGKDAVSLALELIQAGSVSIVSFNMSDKDIDHICRQRWTMTSSETALPGHFAMYVRR